MGAELGAERVGPTETPVTVETWETRIAEMHSETAQLRKDGLWRSGGRTLLHELGLHHSEVTLCRGIAWLLKPEGWHGLGSRVLTGLLDALDVTTDGAERASVVVEEIQGETRADLIVRLPTVTVLIEAKVLAPEGQDQCDRLAEAWADEAPTLVFLTRYGTSPVTSASSQGQWHTLSWPEFAAIARRSVEEAVSPSPGALELIETIERYGGSQ